MADPDQLLAQQANQTMAVMQLIGSNTQRAFENTFRAQQSQINVGMQLAQDLETKRMNDNKILELNQAMRFRAQDQAWQQKNQAFQESLQPMMYKLKEFELQNQFRAQAERQLSPFLTDVRGEFASFVNDMPDLAGEAQNVYATSINNVLQRSVTDPDLDISSEIEKEKVKMRQWVEKQKAPKTFLGQVAQGAVDSVNDILGTKFDPLAKIKEDKPALDRDKLNFAGSVYQSFGGNPLSFAQKNDPTYRANIEASFRRAYTLGEKPKDEELALYPPKMQQAILERVRIEENKKFIMDQNSNLVKQMTQYAREDKDLIENELKPINAENIKAIQIQLNENNAELRRALGQQPIKPSGGGGGGIDETTKKDTQDALSEIGAKTPPTTTETYLRGLFDRVSPIMSGFGANRGRVDQLKNTYVEKGGKVDAGDLTFAIETMPLSEMENLARQEWFQEHVQTGPNAYQVSRATRILSTNTETKMNMPGRSNIERIWSNEDKDKAKKILKDNLPEILLRYLNKQE